MIAAAPGKIVLSGAYAVLEGAPALVTAVDRYVMADTTKQAERRTDEIDAAIEAGVLRVTPWFDARALRTPTEDGDRKLGLGSSAAIVVAAIAAGALERGAGGDHLGEHVFSDALAAHRVAQPSGSGVDVAASCFGGVVRCELDVDRKLRVRQQRLPEGVVVEVFGYDHAASTAGMLKRVQRFADESPQAYRGCMDALGALARDAAAADSGQDFVQAMRAQYDKLGELGELASAPIVDEAGRALASLANRLGGCFGPAGAGGGDVAVWLAEGDSPQNFRARAAELGLKPLRVSTGARGVHEVLR